MAGPFWVDDGGTPSDPFGSWGAAAASVFTLDTAKALAAGEIIYIGHDSATAATSTGDLNLVAGGLPVILISALQGSSPPTYAVGTANQVQCTGILQPIGSLVAYGVRFVAGSNFSIYSQLGGDSIQAYYDCTLKLGANGRIQIAESDGKHVLRNCTIDLTNDGTTVRNAGVYHGLSSTGGATHALENLSFVNPGYRYLTLFIPAGRSTWRITGGDFSGFNNASTPTLFAGNHSCTIQANNLKLATTWIPFDANFPTGGGTIMITDSGNTAALAKGQLSYRDSSGTLSSSQSIYRTGGAEVEGQAISWLCTTRATYCVEDAPHYTPWIYGKIDSTGSKVFSLSVVNDSSAFNDNEMRLEVWYKDTTAYSWALLTDGRADRLATPAAQATDSGSTWNGSGPSFTYKQKLEVTATVNTTGLFRARVVVGRTNILSSAYFYIDPKVTVS